MESQILSVKGMTCAACAGRIERVIGRIDGVKRASVNLASEKLLLEYDEGLPLSAVKDAVSKLGFEIEEKAANATVIIPIEGMSCAACAQRIEKVLRKTNGVESVSVNPATEKATVTYSPQTVRSPAIRAAIDKLGFKALEASRANAAGEDGIRKQKEINTLKTKFIVAAVFCIPLVYIAMAPMVGTMRLGITLPFPSFLEPELYPLNFAVAQIILTLPIIAAGYKFFTTGFSLLFRLSPNMDSLVAIGSGASICYGLYNTAQIAKGNLHAAHMLYFESAGVIITLILLGKTLEAVSKGRTGEALKKLIGLAPETAIILQDGGELEIPADEVEIGDTIIVKPGAKIPVDGIVLSGSTAIDESMLTGESMPVDKKTGDAVYAASINTTGSVLFRAEKVGEDTALAHIIRLVEEAQGSKAPIAKLADIVAGYFVPSACFIAVCAGMAWYIGTGDTELAMTVFISVLVIACPCALGLATPTAIMVGTGMGAENGILIKGGETLETAYKINTIIFDKTGTITEGKPKVTDVLVLAEINRDILLQTAASAEKNSEHPLGQAIVRHAQEKDLELWEAERFDSITGRGIEAVINGRVITAGNRKLMEERGISLEDFEASAESLAEDGKTPMFVAENGKLAGVIAVADVVKKSSRSAIECLQKMGVEVAMLTGDNRSTAAAIARQVGIERVLAEVLPQDKSNEVKKLQDGGRIVAMAGDGINDAPALTQADVGIAVGSGTDVAIESANIVLMRSDLLDVPAAIQLSKKTMMNIKQNLFWAFGYNAVCIPVAAGVLYLFGGPLLNPMIAAAAMSLSSVSVVTNALRLKRFKPLNNK